MEPRCSESDRTSPNDIAVVFNANWVRSECCVDPLGLTPLRLAELEVCIESHNNTLDNADDVEHRT